MTLQQNVKRSACHEKSAFNKTNYKKRYLLAQAFMFTGAEIGI